jgi:beta-galactosidase
MPPILPFNDVLGNWVLTNRTFAVAGFDVVVTLACSYTGSATGAYTLSFDGAGGLSVAYDFTWTGADVTPRQIGVVMSLPTDLALLSWRRTAQWPTDYPTDHIGRPAGNAVPANAGPAPGFNSSRAWPWCNDPSPLGDADFRSTRHNVSAFQLGTGARALTFVSANGTQHARAWVAADGSVGILAADLSNEGDNPFARTNVLPYPTVAAGSIVSGIATFLLGGVL